MPILTPRWRLMTYKRLISVSAGEGLSIISVSGFNVSCPSLGIDNGAMW